MAQRSQGHSDLIWRHPAECLVQYKLGHFVEKQVGFGFAAILREEHSGFGELLGGLDRTRFGGGVARCPESRPLSATYFTHPPPPLQAPLILTFSPTPPSLISLSTLYGGFHWAALHWFRDYFPSSCPFGNLHTNSAEEFQIPNF